MSSWTTTMSWAAVALVPLVAGLTTPQLRDRSIYQVITDRFARADGRVDVYCDPNERTYCGGGWKGIEHQLGYIQGMGFDTVWISPVVANIPGIPDGGESYHGYWGSDITKHNPHFGTEQDLRDLSNALHARGMYLMVDVVANHVGAIPNQFQPIHYGPLFSAEQHFHPFCIPDDWNDQVQSEQCWLTDHTADLNTESPEVVFALQSWVRHLVSSFGIDALRVDTVKHVRKDFWPGFVNAGGVAAVGEILHGDPHYLRQYQLQSMESIMDYATFYHLRRAFSSPTIPIDELTGMISRVHKMLPDPTLLGSFLDNHDHARFPSEVRDPALLKNAAVYTLINDGFPIVYQGQEHGLAGTNDPHNREAIWLHGYSTAKPLYVMYSRLNHARQQALQQFAPFRSTLLRANKLDPHTILIAKPPLVSILTNYGSRAPPRVYYLPAAATTFAPRMAVIDVLTGQVFATDPMGGLAVTVISGEPRVFLPLGVWEGRKSVVWQVAQVEQQLRPAIGSPKRKTGGASTPGHSRGSSRSSMFSWFRGSK